MWHLWTTAQTWRARPSELLGLDDALLAFVLDDAVALVGRRIEAHCRHAESEALRSKRDPAPAARRALDEALGVSAARARRAASRPRRRYRYEVAPDGLPRPVPIEE